MDNWEEYVHRRRTCNQQEQENQFKIRNPDKPVRMGWTINKLAEVGENRGSFVLNQVVEVGKATYTDVPHGKTYNIVNQLVSDEKGEGIVVAMDSGFPTLGLLKDAKYME